MKIRRLDIQGFKSFAERTVLTFDEGITGVVGPNGCGKSNIVDAIRWAMGEQSAKHLRGNGMQDIIFAGSESRGPVGMAEVTITFKNDGSLVPPEHQRSEEISVTRRLFRDGTSEYAINKVACRLRDILDLFMGTGIGKQAYSIIEQGRIGLIVTAKPEDRRVFIEEAAGISRYKARRKQAERRIEATEQNLLRVSDITEELRQRIGSLERQAKKAERYKRLKEELRELDLCAAAHRYFELTSLERYESSVVASQKIRIEDDEASIEQDELRIQGAVEALSLREHDLRARESSIHEHQQAHALCQNNAEFLKRELDAQRSRREEADRERTALSEELVTLANERTEAEDLGLRLVQAGGEEQAALGEREDALARVSDRIDEAQHALEADKDGIVSTLTAIAQHNNNLKNLDRASADLDARLERAKQAGKSALDRLRTLEKESKETRHRLQENRQLKLALEDRRTAQEGLLERLRGELIENEAALLAAREELMDKRSRLNSLLEIQRNYEGCKEGVRSIMRAKERDPSFASTLHGLVADFVSADPRFETAVEAVLGDRLQYVVVSSQSDGVASIDYLKQTSDGRSSFIPLDLREDHVSWAPRSPSDHPRRASSLPPGSDDIARPPVEFSSLSPLPVPDAAEDSILLESDLWPDLRAPGVCGKLVDLVSAQPGYEHVARVLLGDVVVVEELRTAQKLWRENGHRKTLVTLSGEVLDPVGVLTGGASEIVSAGMLAQKREIKELSDQLRMLEARVKIAEERHNTLKNRIGELERAIKDLSREGHQEELSIVKLERDLRRLEDDVQRHAEEKNAQEEEVAFILGKRSEIEREKEESRGRVVELEEKRLAAERNTEERARTIDALREDARGIARHVTQLKITVAANAERREGSARSLSRIIARMADIDARLRWLSEVIDESAKETERLEAKIEASITEEKSLEQILEEERREAAQRREGIETEGKQLRDDDARTRARRKEIDGLKDALSQAQMRVRELQLGRESLHQQIDERYRVSLLDVLPDYHLSRPQDDEHREKIDKLRGQLDAIGPINLTAIDEYNEVSERHAFLSRQKEDLEQAIASLRAAIKRINKTSKDRYVQAFQLVNEKFQQVFPRLFSGGSASLVMVDESDPLECGIEMLAQPPGKKLQSVSLLSGGEKALTAVALIFSIFLIKPTPFCLLDEVDAPLDEANVGRYNDMVRDMSSISQFILITHNKKTMELPDRLYGVTMEEPGISKIVPVDVIGERRGKLRVV